MRHLVLILGLMLAGPASAAPDHILPTLFDVTGVAADDVLNIRQTPDAAAPVIATLPPDATAIEVVAESQGWGRVNSGEASGWVAMRYLSPRPDVWTTGQLPADFRCFGTEPFWDVAADQTQITLRDLDDGDPQPVIAVMDRGIPRGSGRKHHADRDAGAMLRRHVGPPVRPARNAGPAGRQPAFVDRLLHHSARRGRCQVIRPAGFRQNPPIFFPAQWTLRHRNPL